MPQRVSCCVGSLQADASHPRESLPGRLICPLLFVLLLTLFLAIPGQAQSRATLQVAARVLPAEPSRSALALVSQALREPRWTVRGTVRETRLAQVTVMPPSHQPLPTEPRRIRVDFLRN
jgi:hypothetical protein